MRGAANAQSIHRISLSALALLWLGASCASTPAPAPPDDFTMSVLTGERHIVHEVWFDCQGPFWCVLDAGNA
ncbi:MAG: hypothetical protein AAF726_20285 [Planctomycetota bacterium]